jgi:FkbM family methyltransferase
LRRENWIGLALSIADRARRVRHLAVLRDQDWLWRALRGPYRSALAQQSRRAGIARTLNGETFRFRFPYSEIDSAYEQPAQAAFRELLSLGAVVFDVGANVGFYTLAAARAVGASGSVVAFEPSPATAAVLADHVALNGFSDRVEVIAEVVDETTGEVEFWEQGTSLAASIARVSAQTGERFLEGHVTGAMRPAVSLDDFCGCREIRPDVLKLDAEGAEGRILRGATDARCSPRQHPDRGTSVVAWATRRVARVRAPPDNRGGVRA